MIKYVRGDFMQAPEIVMVHGCNSHGVMGSGVAKLIKEKYPTAYMDYYNQSRTSAGLELGFNVYSETLGKIIVNAITQDQYGKDGARYVSYDAVDGCMRRLREFLERDGMHNSIAMPKIGAGLGGGKWEIIEQIILTWLWDYNVTVYEL